jgi:hypothetical protein
MRRDWILGLGASSTLLALVYADLALALVADRGQAASHLLWRGFRWTRGSQPPPPSPSPRILRSRSPIMRSYPLSVGW